VVKDYGYPLQYSVFVCDLTAIELIGLKSDLEGEAHLGEDSIAIFDLGRPTGRGVECIEFLGVRRRLEEPDEPAIWRLPAPSLSRLPAPCSTPRS